MAATDRLVIEPLDHPHAAGLVAALDDDRVAILLGGPDVTTEEAMHERIARLHEGPPAARAERWWNFAVVLAEPPQPVIGRLEATTYGDWGEVAYVFGPRWWGHGYATEGLRWLVGHLASAGITDLWAAVTPVNVASRGVLERAGFTPAEPRAGMNSYDPGDLVLHLAVDAAA